MVKAFIPFLVLSLSSSLGFAQQKTYPYTIQKDTINLKGIVYDVSGKPMPQISVISKQRSLQHNLNYITAVTDNNGMFELKGAMPQDTITIDDFSYKSMYLNKGSRFMIINLPPKRVYHADSVVLIRAPRVYPKFKPSFKITPENELICIYSDIPEFPGGIKHFLKYIQKNLKYPPKAIRYNIEGTVEIGFNIERDGSLASFHILRGIGYGCDEEALRILATSPKWRPGKLNNRSCVVSQSVEIEFKLLDK